MIEDKNHVLLHCPRYEWIRKELYNSINELCPNFKPDDNWSCIAHLSAEDMLKSAVIEEKKFKHSPWVGADNPLGPKSLCKQEGLITMAISCKFEKNLFHF